MTCRFIQTALLVNPNIVHTYFIDIWLVLSSVFFYSFMNCFSRFACCRSWNRVGKDDDEGETNKIDHVKYFCCWQTKDSAIICVELVESCCLLDRSFQSERHFIFNLIDSTQNKQGKML